MFKIGIMLVLNDCAIYRSKYNIMKKRTIYRTLVKINFYNSSLAIVGLSFRNAKINWTIVITQRQR